MLRSPTARAAVSRATARTGSRPSSIAALVLCLLGCGESSRDLAPTDLAQAQVPPRPVRIVPSTARALEFAAALVGPERIAGLPEQGFEYATLGQAEARFAVLPRFYAYRAEDLLVLQPDLVLGDPWQPGDTDQRLLEAGVRVVRLPETVTWREAANVLEELGRILGEGERAAALVAELGRRVERLAACAPRRAGLRAVPYSNFGSEGFSAGAGTTIDEVLRLAGINNACSAAGLRGHVRMDFEQLLVLDPDLIVISAPLRVRAAHAGDRGGASGEVLLSEPRLASLRAVRERRIVELPPGLYACASHLVVEAAEVLARAVDELGPEPVPMGGGER